MHSELLNTKQAAQIVGLSPSTMAQLRHFGNGPPYYKVGGKFVRYDSGELSAWMRSRRYQSTSEEAATDGK